MAKDRPKSGIGSDPTRSKKSESIVEPLVINTDDAVKEDEQKAKYNERVKAGLNILAQNATLMRSELLTKMLNPGKDIDFECGYPVAITTQEYKDMYERNGIASRVVDIFPEESWVVLPDVYENEEPKKTEFEDMLDVLDNDMHIYQVLQEADMLCGIGRFGVVLLGLSDGKNLKEVVDGIDPKTGEVTNSKKELKLLYLKVFDENSVDIDKLEEDSKSPRYGMPVTYTIKFAQTTKETEKTITKTVHWTRIIHLADNRRGSSMFGKPRMKKVYNYLLDIRKILGGSGEMFWKGGFPGYAFKVDPEMTLTDSDKEAIKDDMRNYAQSLQRYLSFTGIEVNTLDPQVEDPTGHLDVQIDAICITIGVPKRIFVGSERGELASTQDSKTWNKRIAKRQTQYLTPYVIRPFIDRLIAFGVLPEPVEYFVDWPDLNAPSDNEIAETAVKKTDAMSKYVAAGVDTLVPPKEYFVMFLGMTVEEAEQIEKAADRYIDEEGTSKVKPQGQDKKQEPVKTDDNK